jgi:hypothetical protein
VADTAGAALRPAVSAAFLLRQIKMESTDRARRSYAPPRLMVYGLLEELTLTAQENMNKNDPVQGGVNLKT